MKATSASALTPRKSKPRKRAVLGSDIAYLLEFWAVASGDPVFGQAAAPPTSVMNVRRLIQSPRRRARAASAALRARAPWRS